MKRRNKPEPLCVDLIRPGAVFRWEGHTYIRCEHNIRDEDGSTIVGVCLEDGDLLFQTKEDAEIDAVMLPNASFDTGEGS